MPNSQELRNLEDIDFTKNLTNDESETEFTASYQLATNRTDKSIQSNEDEDDYDDFDDEVNRLKYQKKVNFAVPTKEPENAKNITSSSDESDNDDQLFKALRRMSTSLAPSARRFSCARTSIIPFQPHLKKQLAALLNTVLFTDGSSELKDENFEDNEDKKILFLRNVRCIGTRLANCVLSDVISIDINSDSTLLPMMCKLMLISEGAAVERGIAVMVRDAGVQVSPSEIKTSLNKLSTENVNSSREDLIEESDESDSAIDTSYTKFEQRKNIQKGRTTHEATFFEEVKGKNRRFFDRFSRQKVNNNTQNISGRRDSYYRRQSYHNLPQYLSIPYYQYQQKVVETCDASCGTDDFYYTPDNNIMIVNNEVSSAETKADTTGTEIQFKINDEDATANDETMHLTGTIDASSLCDLSTSSNNTFTSLTEEKVHSTDSTNGSEEEVEIQIPIEALTQALLSPIQHANSRKYNRNLNGRLANNIGDHKHFGYTALNKRKRSSFSEKLSRFEAEITLYNLKGCSEATSSTNSLSTPVSPKQIRKFIDNDDEFRRNHCSPAQSYSYQYRQNDNSNPNINKETLTKIFVSSLGEGHLV